MCIKELSKHEFERYHRSPASDNPVIINDMLEKNTKTPRSTKRISKIGRKYRSNLSKDVSEKHAESCVSSSTGVIKRTNNSSPLNKHFIKSSRNCVTPSNTENKQNSEQNCRTPDRISNHETLTELEKCSVNKTPEDTTSAYCSQTYRKNISNQKRNCVSPSDIYIANIRNCKSPPPTNNTNVFQRLCQNPPCCFDHNSTSISSNGSSPSIDNGHHSRYRSKSACRERISKKDKSSSPVNGHDAQRPRARSTSPCHFNCLRKVGHNTVSPLSKPDDVKNETACSPPEHIHEISQPVQKCWSSSSDEVLKFKDAKPTITDFDNGTNEFDQGKTSVFNDNDGRNEVTTRRSPSTDNSEIKVFQNEWSPSTKNNSIESQGPINQPTSNNKTNADNFLGSDTLRSTNPIKTINAATPNRCELPVGDYISPRLENNYFHTDQNVTPPNCSFYDQNTNLNPDKTRGEFSKTTDEICSSSTDDCLKENIEQHFRNIRIIETDLNSTKAVKNIDRNCQSPCHYIKTNIAYDETILANDCDSIYQNETKQISSSGNDEEGSVSQFPSDYARNKVLRSNSPVFPANPDNNDESEYSRQKSAKEVNKLGKKCRSISSANQERRRWGTPLTLILYVKKKCQSKIRKILASRNHVAASKNIESKTEDDIANITQNCSGGQNIGGCETNSSTIQNDSVTSIEDISHTTHLHPEDKQQELTEEKMVRLESFSRLDPSTLKVIGWSSGASDSIPTQETDSHDDESMCKLSRVEFKRLQEQVRDVSFNLRNRFRTSAYQQINFVPGKKLYQQPHPTPLENAAQLYRTQLAASLRAFKPKEWPPLNTQELETSYLRCKPINCQNESNSSQSTRCCTAKVRPKSVPPSAFRNRAPIKRPDTPTDVRPGNFDSLNPRVLSHLLSDTITTSSYGEIPTNINKRDRDTSPQKSKDDDVSTSGIDSNPTDDTSSSSDEDDSDYEPEVDENRLVPDLFLRPEKLDSLLLPDSSKGWKKFDFDANIVNIPIYSFANPLPDPFQDLDLRQIARLKWNWRDQTKHRTREKGIDDILDRMVELERLQIETEEWEQKRSAQVNKRNAKRVMSAKFPRDKRCCGKCLQPACAGDCPEKNVQSETCELCRQQFCVKTCSDTKYEQRMRQSRSDDKPILQRSLTPKYCKSCQTKHNAKMINANNIVLGRPKSCNSTYSRGQASNKPKDYRSRSDTPVSIDMFQEFDKLGIDPQQPVRPSTAKLQRPRSRNSSFPSKSFYSQRRDSLTEADRNRFKKKGHKNSKVLVRRPKTAV